MHAPSITRAGHDGKDGAVGLAHAFAGEDADVADGVVDPLGHDALAALELAAVLVHLVAQDARVDAGGDLGRAGGFGAVADGAAQDRDCVDDGVGDGLVAAVQQVGDARARAHPGADRAW